MRKSLIEESKVLLERDRTCLGCGFNSGDRVASVDNDCIPSECPSLMRKMAMLKPYYDTKFTELIEAEKSVKEQISDKQRYLYEYYSANCKKDGEEPLSFDLWLMDRAKARDERVIQSDGKEDMGLGLRI